MMNKSNREVEVIVQIKTLAILIMDFIMNTSSSNMEKIMKVSNLIDSQIEHVWNIYINFPEN